MSNDNEILKKYSKEKAIEIRKKKQKELSEIEGRRITIMDLVADLAERSGICEGTLENWVKGKHKPETYDKLCDFSDALGVSPEDLCTEEIEKDKVNTMSENKAIINSEVVAREDANKTGTTIEQFKLMSSSMNDMFDSMKKYQEITGVNKSSASVVYSDISDFLETYRTFDYGTGSVELNEKFNALYRNFKKLRFELPKLVYNKLEEFITQYLFMIIGIDNVLLPYFNELEERTKDVVEYLYGLNDNLMSKRTYWIDYSLLKNRILEKNAYIIDYTEPYEKQYCDQEYDVYDIWMSDNPDVDGYFEYALTFIKELLSWLGDMISLGAYKENDAIDNPQLYKNTCINNAYCHLDGILSIYIP